MDSMWVLSRYSWILCTRRLITGLPASIKHPPPPDTTEKYCRDRADTCKSRVGRFSPCVGATAFREPLALPSRCLFVVVGGDGVAAGSGCGDVDAVAGEVGEVDKALSGNGG